MRSCRKKGCGRGVEGTRGEGEPGGMRGKRNLSEWDGRNDELRE